MPYGFLGRRILLIILRGRTAHGIEVLLPELAEKVRAAIREEEEGQATAV